MAEVFGVVASAVALLHLSVKGARFLRAIPEIEDDFKELCEEIKSINDWVAHANSTTSHAAIVTKCQLEQAARRLGNIAKDLTDLESRLKKESDDGDIKVKRTKWLNATDKIAKLLQRARNAKHDLALAIQLQQFAQLSRIEQISTSMSLGLVQNEQAMGAALRQLTLLADREPPSDTAISEQPGAVGLPDSCAGADGRDTDREITHRSSHDTSLLNPSTRMNGKPRSDWVGKPPLIFSERMRPSCPEGCSCGCHASTKSTGLIHSTFLGWRRDVRCQCGGTWKMEYRPPWVRARVFLLSGNYYTLCSLRCVRVIAFKDTIWGNVVEKPHIVLDFITNGGILYPDDRADTGFELIEHVVNNARYELLEFLLMEWRNILPKQGLSRRVAYSANRVMRKPGTLLGEAESHLLETVISFSEVVDEPVTSKVHKAAWSGQGMMEALAEDGWAKDMLDDGGLSPLHMAAVRGHVDAVQQLIDAGADVNIQDNDMLTALAYAANVDEVDCMRRLLLAGCRADRSGLDGRIALHFAAESGSIDAVRLLLSAGRDADAHKAKAMASTRCFFGYLPLHYLANSPDRGATPEGVEESAAMLLAAYPEGIQSPNYYGTLPIFQALTGDNLPLLRSLIRADVSLSTLSRDRGNLLHYVAGLSSWATLDFLLQVMGDDAAGQQQFINIDHQLRNNCRNSFTPWEVFLYCVRSPPWANKFRHPNVHTQTAFVKLYQRVRDANLLHDISVLRSILDALSTPNSRTARDHLWDLSTHKARGHNHGASAWYRGLAKQIDGGETNPVAAAVEQDLFDLNEELQASPWDQETAPAVACLQSQWLEMPDNSSIWVEPASAILSRDTQQAIHGDKVTALIGTHLSDKVTQIYSSSGKLLYESKASSESLVDALTIPSQ